jgi:hypothetical protein
MMSSIVSGRTSAALMRTAEAPPEAGGIVCGHNRVEEYRSAVLAPTLGA